MGSAAAAAAAAAAMSPNFVLFPFLDQLHHASATGAFPAQLQNMQPFLQKNNVCAYTIFTNLFYSAKF